MPSPGNDGAAQEDSTPVDLSAVRSDDEFIDALLSQRMVPTPTEVDYELAGLLSTWRADVVAVPIGPHPTLEEVEAGIAGGQRADTQRRSLRIARYAGGAAAAFAILFGGVSVVAHEAAPGDALWGVKEVMFGADASSTMAMEDVEANIDRAAKAIVLGDKSSADSYLESAQSRLNDVRDAGERSSLERKISELRGLLQIPVTPPSTSESTRPAPVEVTTTQPTVPPVTVTAPQETVTVTPTETVVSEPSPSESVPPETSVSEPPPPLPSESTEASSSVPVAPPA